MELKIDGKNIILTMVVSLIIGIAFYAIALNTFTNDNTMNSSEIETDELQIDQQASRNFSISENIDIEFNNMSYNSYIIKYPSFTNDSANETMNQIFCNVTSRTIQFSVSDQKAYDYWITGGIYGINPFDHSYFYCLYRDEVLFLMDEIENNHSLINITDGQVVASQYVRKCLGEDAELFTLENMTKATVYYKGEDYIKVYKYTYSRRLNGLIIDHYAAGKIQVMISPDGEILGCTIHYPDLEIYGTSVPIRPMDAINHIDENFMKYRPSLQLEGVENDIQLVNIELAYIKSDDQLIVGWKMTFSLVTDKTITTNVFISSTDI